jgi:iron-sulfur cluster assembly accessory protein
MFSVTEKASEMIKEFLKNRPEAPSIRVLMQEGGCAGPSLGMALDESQAGDEIFEDRGITYLVDKELFEKVKPIALEFIETPRGSGFLLTSALSQTGGCCSSSCSGCH